MKLSEYQKILNENQEYREAEQTLRLHFSLADAILKARLEKGLSQSQLAQAIGTKQANISKIEAGLGNPTLAMIWKIANTLELEVSFSKEPIPEIPMEVNCTDLKQQHVRGCIKERLNEEHKMSRIRKEGWLQCKKKKTYKSMYQVEKK
jgi:transcriptional regulator with XRE-family HTH domain